MLTTLATFKARLGIGAEDTTQDTLLQEILSAVSAMCEGPDGANCPLELADEVVTLSVPDFGTQQLWLPRWPIVAIDEVLEALWSRFEDSGVELVEGTDFFADKATGRLVAIGINFLQGIGTIQVTYTGGYTTPDQAAAEGYEAEAGEVPLPADIQHACLTQAVYEFQRRANPGVVSEGAGSSNANWQEGGLLPGVQQILEKYRRYLV